MTETAQTLIPSVPGGAVISDSALTQAVTGGHTFANNGKQFLVVQNGDVGSTTVTIAAWKTEDSDSGLAVPARTVTVAAGARKIIGPFKPSIYNKPADALVHLTFSNFAAGVLLGVLTCAPDSG